MSQVDCLKGKRALITGASRGLGKALAMEYASKGCNIVLVASRKNEQDLNEARDKLELAYPGDHIVRTCNLSDAKDITSLLRSNLPLISLLIVLEFF